MNPCIPFADMTMYAAKINKGVAQVNRADNLGDTVNSIFCYMSHVPCYMLPLVLSC